jgi:uncharacterized OsmC-like protein
MDESSRRRTNLDPMMSQLLRTCGPVVPNDSGPAPTETLLAALGACLATTHTTKAAAQGVKVDGLEVLLEGRLDLQGLFGLAPGVRRADQSANNSPEEREEQQI